MSIIVLVQMLIGWRKGVASESGTRLLLTAHRPDAGRPPVAQRPPRLAVPRPSRARCKQVPAATLASRRQLPSASPPLTAVDPQPSSTRANPFPEVTDLFCRLPLPALCSKPETFNLVHLMRFKYDLVGKLFSPLDFHGWLLALRGSPKRGLLFQSFGSFNRFSR